MTLDEIKAKYSVQNDADMSYGFMAKFSGVETFSIRAESAEKAEAKAKTFFDEKMRKAGVRVNNVSISKPKRLGVM